GRTFSGLIQSFVAACGPLNKEFLPLYETDAGKKVYQETLEAVQHNFPQYIKELQGTADGSKVPFHKVHCSYCTWTTFYPMSWRKDPAITQTVAPQFVATTQDSLLTSLLTLIFPANQAGSQLARPCSKLADQSPNPHTPTKLRVNWPHHVPSLLTSLRFVICTRPGFSWSSTQPLPGYSAPGVHHLVELLGHTEDALAETLNHIYFVSAHIISEEPQGRWNVTEERFMSLCYAGHLPGFTMSYNHHGLVFSVNIIMAKTLAAGKTPRHFLTRALLASENFVQAQQVLRDAGCGSGDGASINMTFLNQEGDRLFHNAEVGPACGGAKESPLNILTASPHEHMFHANKYLRLQVPQHDGNIVSSSDRRQAAFMRLPEPRSKRDMEIILGDQSDKEFSIFRESGDNDYVKTVAVGIFDCVERTWSIYADNPKTNDPIVVLPLLLKCVDLLHPLGNDSGDLEVGALHPLVLEGAAVHRIEEKRAGQKRERVLEEECHTRNSEANIPGEVVKEKGGGYKGNNVVKGDEVWPLCLSLASQETGHTNAMSRSWQNLGVCSSLCQKPPDGFLNVPNCGILGVLIKNSCPRSVVSRLQE
ncbi:unnamed protein product, partial [Timema podura]|nr:unnamed protein product [Timema podura]